MIIMDFKNNRFNLILIILFVVYAILMFLFLEVNDLFIFSFIITIIAFIAQFIIAYYLDASNFNNYPMFTITGLYLFIQIILSFCLAIFRVSFKIAIAIQVVLLGIFLIFELFLSQAKDHIEQVEENTAKKIIFLSNVRKDVEILYKKSNDDVKEDLFELFELVKYSNPVSNEQSFELENDILIKLDELKVSLNQNDKEEIVNLISLLKNDFKEREIILRG